MYQPPVKKEWKDPKAPAAGRASSTKGSKRTTIQSDAVAVNTDLKDADMKGKRQSVGKEPTQTLSDTKARKTFTKIKSEDGKKKKVKKDRSRSGSEKGQSALSN